MVRSSGILKFRIYISIICFTRVARGTCSFSRLKCKAWVGVIFSCRMRLSCRGVAGAALRSSPISPCQIKPPTEGSPKHYTFTHQRKASTVPKTSFVSDCIKETWEWREKHAANTATGSLDRYCNRSDVKSRHRWWRPCSEIFQPRKGRVPNLNVYYN